MGFFICSIEYQQYYYGYCIQLTNIMKCMVCSQNEFNICDFIEVSESSHKNNTLFSVLV